MRAAIFLLSALLAWTGVTPPGTFAQDPAIPEVDERGTPFSDDDFIDPVLVREAQPVPIDLPSGGGMPADGGDPSDASIGVRPDAAPASPPRDAREELPEQRTERSRTYGETDGSFSTEVSERRMNYLSADGDWRPLDLSLVPSDDRTYDLQVASHDRSIRFSSADANVAMAEAETTLGRIGIRAIGYGVASERAADDHRLTFSAGASTGDVWVQAADYGFEFGATLHSADQPGEFQFALDAGDLEIALGEDGRSVRLMRVARDGGGRDPVATEVGRIAAPLVFDATHAPPPPEAISVELSGPGDAAQAGIELADDERLLTYRIDPAWLTADERVYPVTLDPTICLGHQASGCTANQDDGGGDWFVASATQPSGWTVNRTGYDARSDDGGSFGAMRSLWYFPDVSAGNWPDGAQIQSATMRLQVGYVGGSPGGKVINAYGINTGWTNAGTGSTWAQVANAYHPGPTHSLTIPASPAVGNNLTFTVTDIVRRWYTRSGEWRPNIGILLRFSSEPSNAGELDFRRWGSTATSTASPLLTITYNVPKVELEFDSALGPNYAPATMLANDATTLPIRVRNDGSGFTFSTASYGVGYRFFLADGTVAEADTLGLGASIASGSISGLIALPVFTPPPGQYTLRLDLVQNVNGQLWASDWARPSLYYSRDKRNLNADNTRWTGSSVVERAEFPVTVVDGGGPSVGVLRTVPTGAAGELGINLWGGNLRYAQDAGVGFDDLLPIGLQYGYDRLRTAECGGILRACGWWTNWDEGFRVGLDPGAFTYQGADGTAYPVSTDADGHLISSAPLLLQRQRYTLYDENEPETDSGATLVTAASQGIPAYSGTYVQRTNSNASVDYEMPELQAINLNHFRIARFVVRTTTASGAGIAFQIRNLTQPSEYPEDWFVYTVGTDFSVSDPKVALGGTIVNTWGGYAEDLYVDALAAGFGETGDRLQVTGMKTVTNGQSGQTYTDAVRFTPLEVTLINDTNPSWTSGSGNTGTSTDAAHGTHSIRINATAAAGSAPRCATGGCISTSGNLHSFPFMTWYWKKVGGLTAALVLEVKNLRTSQIETLTYYAGPAAPPGAVNPVQVSHAAPEGWSLVTRNVFRDAQQVLHFFNDAPSGTTASPPAQGPIGDLVQLQAYRPWAPDGNFVLIDRFQYGSLPQRGSVGTVFEDDFLATAGGGQTAFFNRDGLIERVRDRDGNTITLDYSLDPGANGPTAYSLTAIKAATHGSSGSGSTYRRYLQVSTDTPTGFRRVTFTERLGTAAVPIDGRRTDFWVASGSSSASAPGNTYAVGDLVYVSPGRNPATSCTGARPTGCVDFDYTGSSGHALDEVRDPRWTGATSGSGDLRLSVLYSGGVPHVITDRSQPGAPPLLYVLDFDRSSGTYPIPVWQDADMRASNMAADLQLSPDGQPMVEFQPKACSGTCSMALLPAAGGSGDRMAVHQFNGLSRISQATRYRTPGADASVTRQGTHAAAKVDNYADALTANQVAWTQSADQYFASLRDSAGATPDLYRTSYTYNEWGRPTSTSTPHLNPRPNYPGTILSTTQSASDLKGYWRLGDTSGTTAVDLAPNPTNGTLSGGVTLNQTGALVGDGNAAMLFDGSNDRITVNEALPQSAYTLSAWVMQKTAYPTTNRGIVGRWLTGGSGAALYLVSGKLALAHGSQYLTSSEVLELNRWHHIAGSWDGSVTRLYLDGQLIAQRSATGAPGTGASAFEIGAFNNGVSNYHAVIDEVALWSRTLTPSQIASQYAAGRSVAATTSRTQYDAEWHPTQVATQHLASPGFESGATDWDFGFGSGGSIFAATSPGHADVHSGFASFKTGPNGNVQQDVQLVPGQTFRLQVWEKRTGTAQSIISLYAWDRDAGAWDTLISQGSQNSSWTGHAWDVTVPRESDGRIRLALWTNSGGGGHTVFFDDAAIITDYTELAYNANGTVSKTLRLTPAAGGGAPGQTEVRTTYAAVSAHPAIFPTSVTANYADGTFDPAVPDEDVVSFATYDAWGRSLTSTDPDGVTTTTAYTVSGNGVQTDVAAVTDDLSNTTSFTYDAVGNGLTTTSPLGQVSAVSVDHFGRPLDETAADGTVTRHGYDPYGREISTIANYRDGSADNDGSGTDDLTTVRTYDQFGRVTRADADDGLIDQVTLTSYDLLGNVTAQTLHSGSGTSGPRTTTYHFETAHGLSRTTPTGVRLPSQPTAAPTPTCPGASGSTRCNAVSTLDMNGLTTRVVDTYGAAAVTWNDLAGRPAFAWANYVDGVFSAGAPDTDLLTTTQYDLDGRPVTLTDVAGRTTETAYDALGRPVTLTRENGSFATTVYTAGGRVERSSRLAAAGTSDANLAWTRSEYDDAGRQIRTIDHYDIAGDAHYRLASFEAGLAGWSAAATGSFIASGASLSADDAYHAHGARTGAGRLRLTTAASSVNSGTSWDVSSQTYRSGRTYRVRAQVLAPSGAQLEARLGLDQPGGSGATANFTGTGAWQTVEVTWTPGADASSNVRFGLRKTTSGAVDVLVDDVQLWDLVDPQANIPVETAYDADGRVVASVLPPGEAGEAPMVTTTAYDPVGRTVLVSANAQQAYAARIVAGAQNEGLVAYWPLDEATGSTAGDAFGSQAGTLTGTLRWGAPGAVDEARTALSLDGSGYVNIADSASLDIAGPITIEYWIRSDALLDDSLPATTWKGGLDKSSAYALGWATHAHSGSWRFRLVSGGSDRILTSGYFPVEPDRWYHLVGTYDGDWQRLYVDGEQVGATQIGSITIDNSANPLRIGRSSNNWVGDIDEVALYDEALSPSEIDEHFAAGRETDPAARLTTRTDYDGLGRARAVTDPRGIITAYEFDRLGRRTATIANQRDGTGASATSDDDVRSTFAYNALGELIGHCPAVQVFAGGCDPSQSNETQAWRYTYDVLGNRATQVPPVNTAATALETRVWTHDAGGRLTSVTDQSSGGTVSRHTDTTYDGVGRALTERTYLGSGTGNLELQFTNTWNPDGTRASRAFDGTAASPAQGTHTLTIAYDAMGRPEEVLSGTSTETDYAWNADDTLASRADSPLGTTNFAYDWADRQISVDPPNVIFGSGTVDLSYRLDGSLASRSSPNGVTAAVAYDAAKRPTEVTFGSHSLSRTYDRGGNVVSDSRSLSGVSGDAGSGTAAYAYDGLGRVVDASGLSRDDEFSYDRNGNRLTKVEGSTTVTFTYDRTDQLIDQTVGTDTTAFAYNGWGDLTTSANLDGDTTAHVYDAGSRLVSLTPPAAADPTTLHYDALGRVSYGDTDGQISSYRYVGTSQVSFSSISHAGVLTDALIDASGARLALATGSDWAWTVFDLHGNLAATTDAGSSSIVGALRYDAYGQVLDSYTAGSGATDMPWRYQGRINISPDADDPLYDYGARRYRPSLGAFTQLDSYAGQAVNPLSMNRFLYAHANPTTLTDPTGHCVGFQCSAAIDNEVPLPKQGKQASSTMAAAQAAAQGANSRAATTAPTSGLGGTANGPATVYSWQGSKSFRAPFQSPSVSLSLPGPEFDPVYEQLVWGPSSRTGIHDAWDMTGGQAVAAIQSWMIGSIQFGASTAQWAWSSTATLAYDQKGFIEQWAMTGETFGYAATHIPETATAVWEGTVVRAADLASKGHLGQLTGEFGLLGFVGGLRRAASGVADDAAEAAARGSGPDFIVSSGGGTVSVPAGATGPRPTTGTGFQFTGGAGGHGLSPRVADVRIMDPTSRYPNGYVVYMNELGQTVHPYTGQTIPRSDPWAHIPLP